MPEYGLSYKNKWKNGKFKPLSDRGKVLFDYIVIGNEHSNLIGLYGLHHYYVCADLDWTPDIEIAIFGELLRSEIIRYDNRYNLVFVPSFFCRDNNPVRSHTQFKRALAELDNQPRKSACFHDFIMTHEGLIKFYSKQYKISLPEWLYIAFDEGLSAAKIKINKPQPKDESSTDVFNRWAAKINNLLASRFGSHNTLTDQQINLLLNIDSKKGGKFRGIYGFRSEDVLFKIAGSIPAHITDTFAYLRKVSGNCDYIESIVKEISSGGVRGGMLKMKDIFKEA